MTYDEIINEYPECAGDMRAAYNSAGPKYASLNCRDGIFSVTVEQMSDWVDAVNWILNGGVGEPEDEFEERVEAIMDSIRNGDEQLPVFCCGIGCPFIPHELTEGFHRIVAFHRLGLKSVTVIRADDDATSERDRLKRVAADTGTYYTTAEVEQEFQESDIKGTVVWQQLFDDWKATLRS
jgi:hypothetical protein